MLRSLGRILLLLIIILVALVGAGSWIMYKMGHYSKTLESVDCGGFSLVHTMTHNEQFLVGTFEHYSVAYKKFLSTDLYTSLIPPGTLPQEQYQEFEKTEANSQNRYWYVYVDPSLFSLDDYHSITKCIRTHITEINAWQKLGAGAIPPYVFDVASIAYVYPPGSPSSPAFQTSASATLQNSLLHKY